MYRITLLATSLTLVACQSPAPLDSSTGADSLESTSSTDGYGSAGYDDPYFPLLGNGGYDVEHYRIVLDVDVATNHIEGFATIDAVADEDLSRFNLDLSGLEVSGIRVNGESASFWREGQELVIVPAMTLSANTPFQTTVTYSGMPEVVPLPGLPIPGIGWMHERELIITMSEPTGAMNWYPCNNHQLDKATHEFEITVASDYVVAANGILNSVQTRGDKQRYHFVASDPMATYLSTVNIGRFDVEELVGPNELPLTFYFPPATKEEIREGFRRTPEMITTLSEWFGPYPFECYGGVVAGAGPPAALETQTLPVYGGKSPGIGVQIHELTHQWFGNSVSFESWRDLWLAEAFASYAQWLWTEKTGDEGSIVETVERYYGYLSEAEHELMGDPGVEHLFGLGVYVRGPVALHALRLEIGDEAFFGTLKAWTSTFKNSAAGAKDFIALAEQHSDRDLAEFFEAWLYSSELPAIPAMNLPAPKAEEPEG